MATAGRDDESQLKDEPKSATSTASRIRAATRKSMEMAEMVASHMGEIALASTGRTATPIAKGLDQLQSLYNRGVETVFPECPTPAFLLPTGPGAEDYILVFDLSELLTNLRSGVLARPIIELWAARADGYDTDRLAQELAVAFVEQFNAARASLVEAGMQEVAAHQRQQDAASRKVLDELWGPTLGSAAFWTFALGATPVGLLLLWMGQRPRTEIFGLTAKYLRARSDKAAAKRNMEHEVKALESDFDHKRKAFHRAVRRMTVRVHPRLQLIARSFADAGDPTDVPTPSTGFPHIEEYLRHPLYLEALAKRQQESKRARSLLSRVLGRR